MSDLEEIVLFVQRLKRQTEEDLAFQRRADPQDEWVKFLEGKLQAFRLVEGFLQDMLGRTKLH